MSTRWLVIVVASVFVAVLVVAVALTSDDGDQQATAPQPSASPSGQPTTPAPSPSPASPSNSPAPSPSPSTTPATSFAATGDVVAGWYWLRDAAYDNAATWQFVSLPPTGDLIFALQVLATDAIDGARGVDASFFFAWRPASATDWAGRLPVILPNVSPADDPVGYTCAGTVTIPRSTVGDATALTVRISRDDVRDELAPSDVHVAVNAASVALRLP